MTVLVVGATGTVGREVVRQLHGAGVPVRAASREPEHAAHALPPGTPVVAFDALQPVTWPAALDGVDRPPARRAGPATQTLAGNADADAVVDPSSGRPAGRAQVVVLMLASCLPILGAVLLAPVLPALPDAFAGTAGVEALAPLVLTAPALMIGLLAPVAGRAWPAAPRRPSRGRRRRR